MIINVDFLRHHLGAAAILFGLSAFFISVFIIGGALGFLRRLGTQPIREDGPQTHRQKSGTPTMGGLVVLSVWLGLTLLVVPLSLSLGGGIGLVAFFSLVGFVDDIRKVHQKNSKGLRFYQKLGLQIFGALLFCLWMGWTGAWSSNLTVPFFPALYIPLGPLYFLLALVLVVGTVNGVNLTDGLDGLLSIPYITALGVYMVAAFLQRDTDTALGLFLMMALLIGIIGGFLWHNAPKALLFMGDTGSLGLGAFLAFIALTLHQELLLVLVGGLFVAEALSVIIQTGYYRRTRKRIFRMAPLHHHFEMKGWTESKVMVRFWIVSFLLGAAGLLSLL